jgi:hypothetical protein
MAWDQVAKLSPDQLAQIQSAMYASTNSGEGSSSASGPRQVSVGGYNWAPVTDANGNVTGYRAFVDDPNANNSPALYNGRQYVSFDTSGQQNGTGTLSGFKNGGFEDYLPFVLAGAGLGAGALAAGAGAGAGGAAATAGGLDSAGGVLNSAVMGGGAGAGDVGAGLAAGSTAGGLDSAGGVLNSAVMGGGADATTAAATAGGASGIQTLGAVPQVTVPAASTFPTLTTGGGSGVMDLVAKYAGPAASLVGAGLQSSAAKSAADAQTQAINNATQTQKDALDKIIALNEPFRQAGLTSVNALLTAYGLQPGDNSGWAMKDFTPSDLTTDPSYQWRLDQGQQALERSAAAKGGLQSGGFMKDLTNYAQGAASQEYGNEYQRYMQNRQAKVNNLLTTAGYGPQATQSDVSSTQNNSNNVSQLQQDSGNVTAAKDITSANSWMNGITQGLSSYQNNELLKRLIPGYGGF